MSLSNPWHHTTEATFLNVKPIHILFDFLLKCFEVGRETVMHISKLKIAALSAFVSVLVLGSALHFCVDKEFCI